MGQGEVHQEVACGKFYAIRTCPSSDAQNLAAGGSRPRPIFNEIWAREGGIDGLN